MYIYCIIFQNQGSTKRSCCRGFAAVLSASKAATASTGIILTSGRLGAGKGSESNSLVKSFRALCVEQP